MSEELKACPFCGGEPYFDHDDNGWNWIECGKCHHATNSRVSAMEDCKPLLAEAWNARAYESELEQKLLEQAESQLHHFQAMQTDNDNLNGVIAVLEQKLLEAEKRVKPKKILNNIRNLLIKNIDASDDGQWIDVKGEVAAFLYDDTQSGNAKALTLINQDNKQEVE